MAKKLSEAEQRQVDYAHLGLDFSQINFDALRDPFAGYYSVDNYMQVLEVIRDPKNFFFTSKHIFNIEPTIFQLVWLEQLWEYPFPMLIAGRGSSKTFTLALYYSILSTIRQGIKIVIASASFRQAKMVFDYIEYIWSNAPIWRDLVGENSGPSKMTDMYKFKVGKSSIVAIPLGTGEKVRGLRGHSILIEEFNCLDKNTLVETNKGMIRISEVHKDQNILLLNSDGLYEKPIRYIKTPPVDVYEITTERGYSFKCSSKHKVFTTNGIKLAKDLQPGECIISENKYIFPSTLIEKDGLVVDENLAWLFGMLISEGYVIDKNRFGVGMTDKKVIHRLMDSIEKVNPGQHIYYHTKPSYYHNQLKSYCKESYHIDICNQKLRNKFESLGLERVKVLDKKIPWSILQSPRNIVIKFLEGLFEGDGCAVLFKDSVQTNRLGVIYTTASKNLAYELIVVLKKLGYLCNIQKAKSDKSENLIYHIRLNGLYAYNFAKELNINRFSNKVNNCYEKNIEDKPTIYYAKSINKYVVCGRVNGKHKRLGVKKTYEEALELYNRFNIEHLVIKRVELLEEKEELYDFELPCRHNFFGNGMLQHNSVNESIFEIVLRGFTATSSNPVENIKAQAKLKELKKLGKLTPELENEIKGLYKPNQIILSGTSGWDFQHFARYWKKYRKIIKSQGDPEKLKNALGEYPDKGFDYKDYCIIRIPADLLPEGMLDSKAISNAKLTMDKSRYQLEFAAVFVRDSLGFFPRLLIESCVTKEPIQLGNNLIKFNARVRGDSAGRYILGCDPASESDNLAIVILENYKDHNRVVYCWTIRRMEVLKRFQNKDTQESSYYAFIARKIRDLMQTFPIEYIALDSQGGGIGVNEALHDLKHLKPGELPIWPVRQDNPIRFPAFKDYGYDDEGGLHIIEMVQMSCAEYVVEANHGLKQDLQNKMLLFPYADAVSMEMAAMHDSLDTEKYDTLEECILEIEELKDEVATIQHTTTLNGRDRFDTPDTIDPQGKKKKMRKDRYSALLMANALARRLFRQSTIDYSSKAIGGFINQYRGQDYSGQMYVGNDEFCSWANQSILGIGVNPAKRNDPFDYYHQGRLPL